MLKFFFLLLIIGIQIQTNIGSPLEDNSHKLNVTEIPSNSYTNTMKWIAFSLLSPHIITKISWSIKDNLFNNPILGIFEG